MESWEWRAALGSERPIRLSPAAIDPLVAFVRDGLRDPRATEASFRDLVPESVRSDRPVLRFEFDDD